MTNSDTTSADAPVPTGNTYDKYGSTNPIEQRMMRGFFAALDRFLDRTAPTRIFEIGIGEGIVTSRVIERFAGVPVVGLDLPDEELAAQWESRDLSCAFGDAGALPFPTTRSTSCSPSRCSSTSPTRRRPWPSCRGSVPDR